MKGFLLKTCIAITLTGCASSQVELTPAVNIISESVTGHQVSKCKTTQRDLTIPWTLRQYWCGNTERQDDLQTINNKVMNQVVTIQSNVYRSDND